MPGTRSTSSFVAAFAATVLGGPLAAQDAAERRRDEPTAADREAVRRDAARYAFATYDACVEAARTLRTRIDQFLAEPDEERLAVARAAWLAGRDVYGTSEVLRFSDGPIDDRRVGVETFVNAWPVDESYIDYVVGRPESGIVRDTETFPNLSATILQIANERGGEENVSIGWHAIEFLLWGQDLSEQGPGARPASDYVVGEAPFAARRAQYLDVVADLLVEHLEKVRDAWRPDDPDNYRAAFLALPVDEALRRVLEGMVVLSGFEMSGERMAVAYETRDQEDEHSCFSDNTHRDFITNQAGIVALYTGTGRGMQGHGLREVAFAVDPEAARELDRLMKQSVRALAALPVPFDGLLRADDGSDDRRRMLHAIESLEQQAEALAALGLELGFEIPMSPGN